MKNAVRVLSKVLKRGVVLVLATLFMQGGTWAIAEGVTVMTQNLYLGAEIQSLADAESAEDFLEGAQAALLKVATNNFPERAAAKAAEIAEKRPHLVGLQEVYNFKINNSNPGPPFCDYLTDLLNALEAYNVFYKKVAVVKNLDIEIELSDSDTVRVIDRDVILARSDVVPTVTVVNPDNLCPSNRQSVDGCNYLYVASKYIPGVGNIAFKRGFVAVDALIGTLPVRFINTHLEVRDVDPEDPLSPLIQALQAFELVSLLSYGGPLSTDSGPVVVVGDINSSPEHEVIDFEGSNQIVPPYKQLEWAGYIDTWTLRPGNSPGLTCCQEEMLLNPESMLSERVDVIFSSELPINTVNANVVGNDEADKTIPSGLWPSDHAGVVARWELSAPEHLANGGY